MTENVIVYYTRRRALSIAGWPYRTFYLDQDGHLQMLDAEKYPTLLSGVGYLNSMGTPKYLDEEAFDQMIDNINQQSQQQE